MSLHITSINVVNRNKLKLSANMGKLSKNHFTRALLKDWCISPYLLVCFLDVEYFQTTLTGCHGTHFWTAGQRIDPSRESTFVWRLTSTDTSSDRVSAMTYTNWYLGEPSYSGQGESCMHLHGGRSYTWNDLYCFGAICSVCEVDM